jgi:hypothetical protein
MEMKDLPNFSALTKVFVRGSKDYDVHAYQYGTTSHQEGSMSPAAIICPRDVNDIKKSVNYARENGIGIAVRTGGHQYTGASSTSGNNLQLNLSDTFESIVRDFFYDHETGLLRAGVSFSLLQLNSLLRNMKMFIPHGQCAGVHVGGHFQTGGYGMLERAFGMMCDHVEGFEIVLADGEHHKIWRPNSLYVPADIEKNNDDLYWAVLGGSPGNYGIITHLQIRPLHDDKYSGSHGMRVTTPYTKEILEKCTQVMAEMSDDPDCPRNFDYTLTVMTDYANSFYFKRAFKHEQNLTRDEEMLLYYPEQYADGIDWAESGLLAIPTRPIPVILIWFQWSNVHGNEGSFGCEEKKWFDKVRHAMGPLVLDSPKNQPNGSPKMEDMILFAKALMPLPESHPAFDPDARKNYELHVNTLRYTDPMEMSQLTRYWVYEDVREYVQPYEKRVYMTDKTDLSKNGWAKWLSEQADIIAGGYKCNDTLSLVLQIQLAGGKNSEIHRIGAEHPQNSSHSWRTDTTIVQVLDGFYDPRDPNALPTLLKWHEENDKQSMEGGRFCEKDRRYLWGSYHRPDDKDGGASLDAVWDKYFDSREKYDKLIDIKRRVDPEYVFTANMFGVDASNAPESKKLPILGMGDATGEVLDQQTQC